MVVVVVVVALFAFTSIGFDVLLDTIQCIQCIYRSRCWCEMVF